ncbi:RNA-binding motif, single-stranded-interacting protein 3 isoform X1 [Anas acuta]|uniref:RNA binding motif single stranded interacting protein 3 n=4 Tax=Anatidae TaxID=8830 RepID=A0A493SSQ3_ANAPP|nr:RNA-binding motif, single-stranded-interacting protein 3 isoform X1 [Aythya fuligula]XP_032038993.1 RNA-binding motif, single-stranded-interacting protein 3 isoform X1 [Aythya fuligula]XP_038031379.1 RNA-binding motif, single-stranded-interacting protein 3 isoform X1 [Anas platyrhynchos]XP_038031380.1 RNA-binding motif, single-stranded-interacting protein 3 isoform X1 [Anas platyrhynchos]XP_038031381.1 RNA-binding motif, single-stranded-interacting protein 3 isoform X1 [Anas platyrhynchos]X
MEMDVKGVSPCPEPIPPAAGSAACPHQRPPPRDGQPGADTGPSAAADSGPPERRHGGDKDDKKRTTANKTSGAPSYSRWSSSQPHQSSSTVRTYQNSKSRVTMSPGFSSQWNSSQPAWNTYTFPRASLHYQSHASYTYCAGHPAQSYAPAPHPMAPPSPSTNSSNNSSNNSSGEQLSKTNLYIRGLPPGTTDQDLIKLCQPYGKIVSTKAILDKNTNQCKGYGFVDFDSPAAAQKAVASLKANGVQAQMAKQQEQDPTNLYISNLPVSMDEQELENMLKPFGHVISTRILRDANGVSRGVGFARMESTEKCEVVIQHFNGKYLKTPPGLPAPTEPLLCKFADGGQKKRQNQSKYTQNGRPWPREGEAGMALTYDPTAAIQNGFYSSPYSIPTNRMIPQTSITPFIAASPVSTYQVQSTSWMPHPPYVMQPTGAVITPTMDHTMSMQPASMMGPLTQQMNHLSLGTTGTYMTAAAPMQGTYIPQYTPVPPTAVPIEGVVADTSPQTVASSSQEASGQQQQMTVETSSEHAPAYSYQQSKQ